MSTTVERHIQFDSTRQEYYRDIANEAEFRSALAQAFACYGNERVFKFSVNGDVFYVKQRQKHHKRLRLRFNRLQGDGYMQELKKLMLAFERCEAAPEMVLGTRDYFVTRGNGKPLQQLIKPEVSDEITNRAFYSAGCVLSRLHESGLTHGRPVLRDIAYNQEQDKAVLLDWENTQKFSFISPCSLDIILFLHGYFREEINRPAAIKAAIEGYLSEPNGKVRFMEARSFLLKKSRLIKLFKLFDRFGWIDLQAVTRVYDYLLTVEIPS